MKYLQPLGVSAATLVGLYFLMSHLWVNDLSIWYLRAQHRDYQRVEALVIKTQSKFVSENAKKYVSGGKGNKMFVDYTYWDAEGLTHSNQTAFWISRLSNPDIYRVGAKLEVRIHPLYPDKTYLVGDQPPRLWESIFKSLLFFLLMLGCIAILAMQLFFILKEWRGAKPTDQKSP